MREANMTLDVLQGPVCKITLHAQWSALTSAFDARCNKNTSRCVTHEHCFIAEVFYDAQTGLVQSVNEKAV
jgi:hypothetical protein